MSLTLIIIYTILWIQSSFCLAKSHNFSFSTFDYGSCNNGGNLICWGSVTTSNGTLNITPDQTGQQENNKVGRVLFRYPVVAWPTSFSTIFTIRVVTNSTVSGDGMAFIFAQDDKPSPPESFGSFIGILDPHTQGGVLRQFAVEFDTYKNEHDIDDNHIAIDTTSVEYPVAVKSLNSTGIYLKSGRDITVRIDYDGWSKMLQIYAAYAGESLVNILRHKIIMQETVPRSIYVGFTASTAYFSETHQVLNWNFTEYQLPFESLKHGREENNKSWVVLVATIPSIIILLILVFLVMFLVYRKRKKGRVEENQDLEMLSRNAANAPKMFTYRQLAKATRCFRKENLLGTGGFGSVYRGILSDPPTTVAVKKINATSKQGTREYLAEICTIGRLRHKNLVQLQGWCHDQDRLLLVFDYMPNGSLDRYIGKSCLDWKTRYKILTGLASAILYLHEECGDPVVHRDVKPNNVMLDSDYNAYLGDFGLARLLQNNDFVTTMVAGTPGYLAPEVSYTGRATLASDVYSFGMVALEVVCGRRSKGIMEENSLVDHVWSAYEKDELVTCVDPLLEDEYDNEQVTRILLTGLACLHPDRKFRPRMRKVVQIFMNPAEPLVKLPQCRPTAVCISWHSPSAVATTTYCGSTSAPVCGTSLESFPDEITNVMHDIHSNDETQEEMKHDCFSTCSRLIL